MGRRRGKKTTSLESMHTFQKEIEKHPPLPPSLPEAFPPT